MENFEIGPIRPPSEANSLLIRVTRGCHWNKCNFCGLYKENKFSMRPFEEIKEDIIKAAEYYDGYNFTSCFLQDGDAFILKTEYLLNILEVIREYFPKLEYITSYARANSITRKSLSELKEIRSAGLNHLYCGIETGSDTILKYINKGFDSKAVIESGVLAKEAGYILSEFTLLGIGGKDLWKENADKTAETLNIIKPDYIRVHATGIKPESKMGQFVREGSFKLQSEEEIVIEQKRFIEKLDTMNSYYVNEHAINLLMEVRGNLLNEKDDMLQTIDNYLSLSKEDKLIFAVGRRLGVFYMLQDIRNEYKKKLVLEKMNLIKEYDSSAGFANFCNEIRQQMI